MLYSIAKPYRTISIVGMCKNAGKTTVLNRLARACARRGELLGLTSVGRDGESRDVATGTRKPEIFVYSGALVATAEQCAKLGNVSREIIDTTGMPTPMGEIVLLRATSDGLVQLAGPSMTVQLAKVRDMLFAHGAGRVLIDGAISRKSLAMPEVSEAVILCTGASYSQDMDRVVNDTMFAVELLTLERTGFEVPVSIDGKLVALTATHGFVACEDMSQLAAALKKHCVTAVFIRGGVTDSVVKSLLNIGKLLSGVELVFEDASRILATRSMYMRLGRLGVRESVVSPVKLLALCVNPFSAYGAGFDRVSFSERMRSACDGRVKVFNVLKEGSIA